MRIVVIGSGFGGLAAAIRLQAAGHAVTVLEALDQPGGRARVLHQDGFTFDAGPTIITAPQMIDDLFTVAGRVAADYVTLTRVDPYYRIRFADGTSLSYGSDLDAVRAQIRGLAPRDAGGLDGFMMAAERIFETGFPLIDQPFLRASDLLRIVPDLLRLRAHEPVARLVERRDRGHWEPTWFSAYGGTIEATTAVLEAIHALGPAEFAVETRDAVRWLLSTSPSWGEWHNERGTAAALRSVAALAGTKGSFPKALEVRVDGKRVRQASIDAKDPLGSVLALGRIDVGSWSAGRHVVELRWDEGSAPVASLVTRTWHTGRHGEGRGAGAQLRASALADAEVGRGLELEVRLAGRQLGGATLRVARSGLVELDMARLGALVGRGRPIAAVAIHEDAIELRLGPDVRQASLALPYRALRRGVGRWPAVALVVRPRGRVASAPLVVDPGPLTLR